MSSPLIWNGLNAKALTNDILIDNANYNALRVGNQFAHNSSTGVESGGILSVNADPTKFDLTAGTGTVVTYTTPTAPTIKSIAWSAFTAQTVTGLGVQDETYILISPLGAIIQQSNYPSTSQRRTNIFIGRIGHSNRTTISFATSFPDFSQSVSSQLFDLFDALGPFNITGNQIANNGATMNFQKSTGSMCFRSFNYPTDNYTPHISTVAAAVPVSFFYRTQTLLVAGGPVTIIQPNQYDNGGVVTAVGGGVNRSTIQRVYLAPNGVVNIQLGQTIYPTLADAIASIGTDPFVQNPAITNVTVLIGYIVLKNSTVALNNTADAMFFKAPKFEVGVGGGVNTVTSLQQTYNSSTQPQIILDSTHGGLQVFDNAAPIAGNLYQVANNTGATNYFSVSATNVATKLPLAMSGATSGTVTTQVQAAAGTFNFNLPTTAGTSGQFLTSGGGIAAPMTWSNGMTNPMTTLGDIIFENATPAPARLPGNTTTQINFLSQTGTGTISAAPAWSTFVAPTVQKFLSGSGTYTTPTSPRTPLYLRVRMVGGGGGGSGSGTGAVGSGTAGGNTTFGTSLLVANGGGGGTANNSGGVGGTASLGAGPIGIALTGGSGTGTGFVGITTVGMNGAPGASSPFGGAGGGGYYNVGGSAAVANTGSGGGGGAFVGAGAGNQAQGTGGGAGGYIDAIIVSPSSTYSFAIGAAGAFGGAGTNGQPGGAGSTGVVIVEEMYQ